MFWKRALVDLYVHHAFNLGGVESYLFRWGGEAAEGRVVTGLDDYKYVDFGRWRQQWPKSLTYIIYIRIMHNVYASADRRDAPTLLLYAVRQPAQQGDM